MQVDQIDIMLGLVDSERRYGTTDLNVYKEELDEMNKSSLLKHAANLGVLVPKDNVSRVKETLISEFKKYISSFEIPKNKLKKEKKITKEIAAILAEGR